MCHAFDALPPIKPILGAAIDKEDLTLEAGDGVKFAAFAARAEKGRGTGMVVLPDVRGLYRFYEELAMRFAEEGIHAVAIDYFGRTAGVGKRDDSFEFVEHVGQTRAESIAADTAAAVGYLRSPQGGACESIFTVGFCFGGANSWMQAAAGHGLTGVVGFYGRPGPGRDGSPGPAQRAGEFACPVLALMGGADASIPPEAVAELKAALTTGKVQHEVIVYPNAPHSFFDRAYEQFASESADAWQRTLEFVRKYERAPAQTTA
jgi:carboxymethylenebutenolidase